METGEVAGTVLKTNVVRIFFLVMLAAGTLHCHAAGAAVRQIYTIEIWKFQDFDAAEKVFSEYADWLGPAKSSYLRIERVNSKYSVRTGQFNNRRMADRLLQHVLKKFDAAVLLKTELREDRIKKIYVPPPAAKAEDISPETEKKPVDDRPDSLLKAGRIPVDLLAGLFDNLTTGDRPATLSMPAAGQITEVPPSPPEPPAVAKTEEPPVKKTVLPHDLPPTKAAEETMPLLASLPEIPGAGRPAPLMAEAPPPAEPIPAPMPAPEIILRMPDLSLDAQIEFYTVQVGSYTRLAEAKRAYSDLEWLLPSDLRGYLRIENIQHYYTVRAGRFDNNNSADSLLSVIREYYSSAIILKAYIKEERLERIYLEPVITVGHNS